MLTCMRPPMASIQPLPSSSPSPSPRRRPFKVNCVFPRTGLGNRSLPRNRNDSFLSRLQWLAENSPERLHEPSADPDMPPLLNLFEPPKNMASSGQAAERSSSLNSGRFYKRRPRGGPPNLASLLLDRRVVYIGLPLVPVVTELIVAQIMYLYYDAPKQPIYLFINSTGTIRDDGAPIASDYEGFAVYDALTSFASEIHTVCTGVAVGHACLLLAAGTKGKRYMFPQTRAVMQQPRILPSGLMECNDALVRAKEAVYNRDKLFQLYAKHTGNSEEEIAKMADRTLNMNCVEAQKAGVVDKILWRGGEWYMKSLLPPAEWVDTSSHQSIFS